MHQSGTFIFVVVRIKKGGQGRSRRSRQGGEAGRPGERVGLASLARQAGQIKLGCFEEDKKLKERRSV